MLAKRQSNAKPILYLKLTSHSAKRPAAFIVIRTVLELCPASLGIDCGAHALHAFCAKTAVIGLANMPVHLKVAVARLAHAAANAMPGATLTVLRAYGWLAHAGTDHGAVTGVARMIGTTDTGAPSVGVITV